MYCFAINLLGKQHVKNDDCCFVCDIEATAFTIAIIADGLGSCSHSHYGSNAATKAAYTYVKNNIKKTEPQELLKKAFRHAKGCCKKLSKQLGLEAAEFETTLTLALYNCKEKTLYYGHCGDGGIVTITSRGEYRLLTHRHKGETISSVCPLSFQNDWEFGLQNDVASFAMSTDGVLDTFVTAGERPMVNMSFFDYALAQCNTDTENVKQQYSDFLKSDKIESGDDLTMVVVNNLSSDIDIDFSIDHYLEEVDEQRKALDKQQKGFSFELNKSKSLDFEEVIKTVVRELTVIANSFTKQMKSGD